MSTKISPIAFAQAQVAAQQLKEELEKRLIDKTSHGFSCGCGACHAGQSKVVAIRLPSYQEHIARWLFWSCQMIDENGKGWSQGIDQYIPWMELYPMFRNAFSGIEVEVGSPHARLFDDNEDGSHAKSERSFLSSGRTVEIANDSNVIVRPTGNLSQSSWVNAELRVDSDMNRFPGEKQLVVCNVDALELGKCHGREQGLYYQPSAPASHSTFYIRIPGFGDSSDSYLPVARVVEVSTDGVTFELDKSVELLISDELN